MIWLWFHQYDQISSMRSQKKKPKPHLIVAEIWIKIILSLEQVCIVRTNNGVKTTASKKTEGIVRRIFGFIIVWFFVLLPDYCLVSFLIFNNQFVISHDRINLIGASPHFPARIVRAIVMWFFVAHIILWSIAFFNYKILVIFKNRWFWTIFNLDAFMAISYSIPFLVKRSFKN